MRFMEKTKAEILDDLLSKFSGISDDEMVQMKEALQIINGILKRVLK